MLFQIIYLDFNSWVLQNWRSCFQLYLCLVSERVRNKEHKIKIYRFYEYVHRYKLIQHLESLNVTITIKHTIFPIGAEKHAIILKELDKLSLYIWGRNIHVRPQDSVPKLQQNLRETPDIQIQVTIFVLPLAIKDIKHSNRKHKTSSVSG